MRKLCIGLIVLFVLSCGQGDIKKQRMEQATIIELVIWKSVEGVSKKEAKTAYTKLNDFVSKQSGFLGRKTALAPDGRFLDLVFWEDLKSATTASEKAMKTEALMPIFSTIDEKDMLFQHFEIFNSFN